MKTPGNLGGAQPAHQPQRQHDLGLGRQARVAAGEHQAQPVVVGLRRVVSPGPGSICSVSSSGNAPRAVGCRRSRFQHAAPRGCGQPRLDIDRYPCRRPGAHRLGVRDCGAYPHVGCRHGSVEGLRRGGFRHRRTGSDLPGDRQRLVQVVGLDQLAGQPATRPGGCDRDPPPPVVAVLRRRPAPARAGAGPGRLSMGMWRSPPVGRLGLPHPPTGIGS